MARDSFSQCVISFGSNLGDRVELISEAARQIASSPLVREISELRTSRLFETPPIGGPGGQEPFLNAVGAFETKASARQILEMLQEMELNLGRIRHHRWGARSIDLDVVLHGELMGSDSKLIVPHPRYTARQFVLVPACDVAGHFRDPRFGWTLQRLAEHLRAGVASMALVGDNDTCVALCKRISEQHGIRVFTPGPVPAPMEVLGNSPAPKATPSENPGLESSLGEPICVDADQPWVAGYLPSLPDLSSEKTNADDVPRLVARIQNASSGSKWPAPHQMWPKGWTWPEYRLEVEDLDWAAGEVASALESMRCPIEPTTVDGDWWK